MCTHRHRELHENIDRVGWGGDGRKTKHRSDKGWTVGQSRTLFINHLDLIAFEHNDIDELSRVLPTAIFDDEQPRFDYLDHHAEPRNCVGDAPYAKLV